MAQRGDSSAYEPVSEARQKGRAQVLQTLMVVGVLTVLGYFGNVTTLPVALSVDFLFGSIFVIIAVSFFGPLIGGVSAFIASSYTFIIWNHPYAIIIFVCEAIWLGFFLKGKYKNIVLIDAAYWLIIGLPLVFIFYFGVMSLGFQNTTIIFLKQSINGIINALIAAILLSHLPWQNWFRLPADIQKVPYNRVIFQLTSAFLMIPLVGMLLFTNYQALKTIQNVAGELLISESRETNSLIHSWLERHIVAVENIAKHGKEQNFQSSGKLQGTLEQIHSLFPDFHNVFVADGMATTVAFFPPINERGEKTIGINFADREWFKQLQSTLKPFISDVFQGRGGIFVPIFSISVPIVEEGKLSGFGLGAVNLDKMRNLLVPRTHLNKLVFTVVDQNNNIICSTNPRNLPLTQWKPKAEGQTLIMDKGFSLWTPSNKKNISVMDVWKDAIYFVALPIANTKWTLLSEMSVAPLQGYLYHSTIVNLAMIFCLFVVAIILSHIVSKLLTRIPVRLAEISRNIPEKLGKSADLIWPESNIAEMHLLIDNFRETTQALNLQYQSIKDLNIHLEAKVQERTTELRESEGKYQILFKNEIYAICIFDLETLALLDVNDTYSRIYGYSREELISGMTIHDITAEHQVSDAATQQAIREGTIFIPLRYHRKKDGTVFPVEIVGGPYGWKGRKVMFALAHDITERKRTEDALRSSKERLDLALKATQDAVWDWDLLANTLYYSSRWWSMVGYAESELDASPDLWRRLMHPDDLERANLIVREAIAGEKSFEIETRLLHKDGHYVSILTRGIILRDDNGMAVRVSGINMDLTDRKKIEEERQQWEQQRQQLQKAESLGRMAGAIAHHFNNQLGVVIGNLEMAMDDLPPDAEPINRLTSAMQAAEEAAKMSGLMLTYLGQTTGSRVPLNLSATCLQILPILRAVMPGQVVLETDLSSPGPIVNTNANQIQQILTNLISNAWEAVGDDSSVIHLGVKAASSADIPPLHRFPLDWQPQDTAYSCLEVTDAGCGIEYNDIAHLFDPFFSTKFTGRGMGLAVVLGIVRAHGGCVTVESESGRGSRFRVFFPVSTEEVSHQPTKTSQIPKFSRGNKVLVVEDEEMVRKMTIAMLERLGFSVVEARDGVEAVEVFQQNWDEVICVLSDLTMPRMNGWETLAALRKLAPNLPVILASGYDEINVMAGDHAERPQAFLGKPYNLKGLHDAIGRVLGE